MALTDEKEQELRLIIACLDSDEARKEMNDWERNFVADQTKRYDQWGSNVNLSPKQWAALEKIHLKITGDA